MVEIDYEALPSNAGLGVRTCSFSVLSTYLFLPGTYACRRSGTRKSFRQCYER